MSPQKSLRICIIGGGVGGLILAQLLREDPQFEVSVFERDSPERSAQSLAEFRILVSPQMLQALRAKLPKDAAESLEDAVGLQPAYGHSLFLTDGQARLLMSVRTSEFEDACSVSRWKLRKALLQGLGLSVKFNKSFKSYTLREDRSLAVHFDDGETVLADLLVGADGAGSRVRRQLLPDAHRTSTGVTVIYWKMPYTPETEAMLPCGGAGCMAVSPRSSFVVSAYMDRHRPYGPYNLEKIDPEDSFLMCGLGSLTKDFLNKSKDPDEMTSEELKAECVDRVRQLHPTFRNLVSLAVPSSVYMAHIKTQDPIKPWAEGHCVTLLGDAAHSMTPYLGKGATSAMADALSLAEKLQHSAENGHRSLDHVLHTYEEKMLADGFKMCHASMRIHRLVYCWGSNAFKARCRDLLIMTVDWALHLDRGEVYRTGGAFFILLLMIWVARMYYFFYL